MRIVVAPDSFKGSLAAPRVARAIQRGILGVLPDADVRLVPMADGGEGTAEALRVATAGTWVEATVTGPLPGTTVTAGYVRLGGSPRRVVVEMATASGMALLRAEQLDPLSTTTYGTGELLAAAMEDLPEIIWLTVGGSATVDGGTGAARALGWRFLDAAGNSVPQGGGGLARLRRIVPPEGGPAQAGAATDSAATAGAMDGSPGAARLIVLADVTNPLVGPDGAARVFAPQKGAGTEAVEVLEQGLAVLAARIRADLGVDVADLQGGGAAGGLAAGAVAFLGGEIVSGVESVMDAVGLSEQLRGADWVVTGEGRFDAQSLDGKVVSGVARRARKSGVKVAVLAGRTELPSARAAAAGIDVVVEASPSTMDQDMDLAEAMARTEELLEAAAARLARGHLA